MTCDRIPDSISVVVLKMIVSPSEVVAMGKGNNSQGKEKKKPKKDAKPAPIKAAPPPKK